jgi:hypothetical protein
MGAWVANHNQAEWTSARETAYGVQQWSQAFQTVVHRNEQSHSLMLTDSPPVAPQAMAAVLIHAFEPFRVDGTWNDAQLLGLQTIMALKVMYHHLAQGNHHRPPPTQVLTSLQAEVRPVR